MVPASTLYMQKLEAVIGIGPCGFNNQLVRIPVLRLNLKSWKSLREVLCVYLCRVVIYFIKGKFFITKKKKKPFMNIPLY